MILIVLTTIIFVVLVVLSGKKTIENFYQTYKYGCNGCGNYSLSNCLACPNCGICTTPSGVLQCTEGTSSGPLFRKDCLSWDYGDTTPPVYTYGYPRYWYSRFRYPRYRYHRGRRYW